MKKFFKWVVIIFVGLVIVSMAMGGEEEAAPTSSEPAAAETAAEPKAEPKKEEKPADKITKENYEAIKTGDTLTGEGGMTIEEVTAILGESTNKTESQTGDMKMEIITWNNGKLTKMASITVSFTNGKASSKNWLE